uniref:DUF4316 domain-containing protein n=1 Tax=Steinernema glaseri TaxID=37863 RepID=A0A1I7ZRQ2_9BILA
MINEMTRPRAKKEHKPLEDQTPVRTTHFICSLTYGSTPFGSGFLYLFVDFCKLSFINDDPFFGEAKAKVPRIADMSHGVATGIPEPDKRFAEVYKDQTREEEIRRLEAQRDQRLRELDDLRGPVEAERQAEEEMRRNQQQRP